MVLDDLRLLVDVLAPASQIAVVLMSGYFCLRAFLALVATFGRGRHRKNAYRVLKVLSRREKSRGS